MNFPTPDQLRAAIELRHSVRRYTPEPFPEGVAQCLHEEIERINARCGFSFKLVTNEPRSFRNFWAYGKFENAVNYIIISAPKGDEATRLCGLEGERLVLGAQALGLNTCWVGLSYSKNTPVFDVPYGHRIRCVISVGYGQTSGTARRSKSVAQVSNASDESPTWFTAGVKSALLAPTAINQQKFRFHLGADGKATASPQFSLVGYTQIDLGIAICHFNLAASGHEIEV